MPRTEMFTQERGREMAKRWASEALPTPMIGEFVVPRGQFLVRLPIVRVDTRGRPDVADLPRVHYSEGEAGECVADWRFLHGGQRWIALLTIRQQRPVRTKFRLMFSGDEREFLSKVAACGILCICTAPTDAPFDEQVRKSMSFEVPTDGLIQVLAATALGRGAA